MAKTTIKLFQNWDAIDDVVKHKAKVGLAAAEDACLSTIEGIWPHGGMHKEGVSATVSGFKSGVSAAHDKKHIAHFADHGTLGNFRRGTRTEPKRPRKRQYKLVREKTYTSRGVTYQAGEPTGIKDKRFYGKGRAAGKRALKRALGI